MSRAAEKRWLAIARGILSRPTATCLEHSPANWVRDFAAQRKLSCEADRYGNLLVKYPGRGAKPKAPPIVLVAHLDHPGFVVTDVQGDRAQLEFRGGVRRVHAKRGTKLEFFAVGRDKPIGQGEVVSSSEKGARRAGMLGSAVARITSGRAAAGDFTMWAFPGYSERGGQIVSRCCDDLLGAAAALATLDEMVRDRPRGAHVWGWFTRAEEVGLYGALAGITGRTIPKDARLLSLETSRALPHAPQGGGVIVRVGDAMSLFDPPLMGALHSIAKELAAADPTFRYQRRLMDGGSCEATAFCAAGRRAGGLAVPLGNYHNMAGLDGGSVGIGPETVAIPDYLSEVRLLVHLASRSARLLELESQTAGWVGPSTQKAREMLLASPLDPPRRNRARSRR
ncbi:MAG: hypothetical protein R3B81_12925 [bacterium]